MLQIIVFFWLLMFCTLCFQFIEPMSQSSNIDRCLAINSLLDCIFPEGWDNFKILVMIISSYGAAYSSDFTKVMREAGYIYPFEWTEIMKNRKVFELAWMIGNIFTHTSQDIIN